MSLYDDFIADYQFEIDFPYGVPCDTWTTKDGTEIPISEMTTSHIKNCIRMLNNVENADGWIEVFKKELSRRIDNKDMFKTKYL